MSILGYSTAYFLPQYWANTPLYGEKIIPLLDYVLSTDYQYTEKLASAFYDIESKYKNTADLPIDKIEAIIEESGYKYIRDLLGQDEESLRLLVYILVLINELKGSKKGVETVLNLLRTRDNDLQLHLIGDITVSDNKEVTGFTAENYITFSNFNAGDNPFELAFKIKTGEEFTDDQCIASCPEHGFYLGINSDRKIVLKVGEVINGTRAWQTLNGKIANISTGQLLPDTEYYIKLYYSGTAYGVNVSTDDVKYVNYLDLESTTGISVTGGLIMVGVDGSTSTTKGPFLGTIYLTSLDVSAKDIVLTQWYEKFPVGEEDTFSVEATVNATLMSSDFFVKFAKFIERYVYPTLDAFKAKMALKAKITFLPYVRQKISYIASNIEGIYPPGYEPFKVVEEDNISAHEIFNVKSVPKLFAWGYNGELVYTLSDEIHASTNLYNRDLTRYLGTKFKIKEYTGSGIVEYYVYYNLGPGNDIMANRMSSADIYSSTPFLTPEDND